MDFYWIHNNYVCYRIEGGINVIEPQFKQSVYILYW